MTRRRLSSPFLLAASAAALAGCVSLKRTPEARFFVLRSLAEPGTPAPQAPSSDPVGVLPVRVPGYLDRPQLVTWVAPGELRIDEFLRWAEPLDAGISRTLAENLDALLPGRQVLRWPWPGSTPLSCRVRVALERFGPEASGGVFLEGAFVVLPPRGERPLARRPFALRREAQTRPAGAGPAPGVEAMNELLLELSREVARAIQDLPAEASVTSTAPRPSRSPGAGSARRRSRPRAS
ncbi:MAG TPA: PqiC family protein [Vicinamibacteria bacterium]|nr:PqiC family protein [Vicinamibacteria bacterium]